MDQEKFEKIVSQTQKLEEEINQETQKTDTLHKELELIDLYRTIFRSFNTKKEGIQFLLNKTDASKSQLRMFSDCNNSYLTRFDEDGNLIYEDIPSDVKESVRERDRDKCVICGNQYDVFHHIIPRSSGGSNESINIAQLCDNCHSDIHYNWTKKGQVPYNSINGFWNLTKTFNGNID